MGAPDLITEVDGSVHVWLPRTECVVCDGALAAVKAVPFRDVPERLVMGPMTYKSVICDEHEVTYRVATADGRFSVTFRGERRDRGLAREVWLPLWASIRNTQPAGVVQADSVLSVLPELAAWGVDPGGDPKRVRVALMEALVWAMSGHAAVTMRLWRDAGVEMPVLAQAWNQYGFTPETAAEWVRAGLAKPLLARQWVECGLAPETVPEGWVDPHAWAFTQVAGVPATLGWGHLCPFVSPTFARIGFEDGKTAPQVEALGRALKDCAVHRPAPAQEYTLREFFFHAGWSESDTIRFEDTARTLVGLDWGDVVVCLSAGLSVEEAAEHLRSGGDMDAMATMAALARPTS